MAEARGDVARDVARQTSRNACNLFGFGPCELADTHVHLDFMDNAYEVAADAASRGICLYANTVTPSGYERAFDELAGLANVRLGVGLHPWWVADGRCSPADVERVVSLVPTTRWVGEVGLDFSARHVAGDARERQLDAFGHIAHACADVGDRVLSIHAVRSVTAVLDVLERTGCLASCACVLHWFSGSTDELWRAIRAGCWFSVNERHARTRRAAEQLKLVPRDRLLLETDLPPEEGVPFAVLPIETSLWRTCDLIGRIRAVRR